MSAAADSLLRREVKLWVPLTQEDGWPPVQGETLWAKSRGGDRFQVDNVPFFAMDLAVDDIVRAERDDHGELNVVEKLEWSGNCTIRVLPLKDGRFGGSRKAVLELFAELGVNGEGIEEFGIAALNVPPTASYSSVKRLLQQGSELGWWDYDEGCIGAEWLAT